MTYPVERVQRFPVPIPQPAAGADWTLTPTGLGAWRILSLSGLLTTSAAVANRAVAITADDQTATYFRSPAASVQAASLGIHYSAFDGGSGSLTIGVDQVVNWPEGGVVLYPGHRLRSVTTLIDVADQWSQLAALVEEFPTGREILATPINPYQTEQW